MSQAVCQAVRPISCRWPAMPGVKQMLGGKRKRRGKQAPALTQRQWQLWLQWLLEWAGARVYFVIWLTGAFGLRCSEALTVRREDIQVGAAIPRLRVTGETRGNRKSPRDVYIRSRHLNLLNEYLKTWHQY